MKNNTIKKLSFALLTVIIVAHLFTLAPFAANGIPTEWSFSDDEQYLTNESESVTYHTFYNGVELRPDSQYVLVYEQSMEYADLIYLSVSANPDYTEAVWINYYDGYEIFVTDKGESDLVAFTEGKNGRFFLEDSIGDRADFDKSIVDRLDGQLRDGVNTKTFDVKDIKPQGHVCSVYNIIVQDESKTFAYTYGAIYSFANGEKWYVNYTDLDNNYFDSNGNFSYRRGSVKMTKINVQTEINQAISKMSPYEMMYEYEWAFYEGDIGYPEQGFFMIVFGIVYIFVIILPAIAIAVLGLALPCFKKLGKPKYWYFVALLAALWLLAALVLAGYLVVVAFL